MRARRHKIKCPAGLCARKQVIAGVLCHYEALIVAARLYGRGIEFMLALRALKREGGLPRGRCTSINLCQCGPLA
ncbi:MAG: hypothetical protein ACI8PP_001505 [Candidatus Pseudothioglobus sp.]|jgi:hypothetical protein